MKINVHVCSNLNGKILPLEHNYTLTYLKDRNKQIISIGPVHFSGFGDMNSGIFTVKGEITGTCKISCSRCLAEIDLPFTQDLEERFNIDAHLTVEGEEEFHQVLGHELNLLPFIEEEVLVAIPFIPVCQPSCAQELPQAGKGWQLANEQDQEKKIDPRLADLAKFFEEK